MSNYQIIEVFLLLEADLHDTLIELLESINFCVVNLEFLYFPGIEHLKTLIANTVDPNRDTLLEMGMERAGFKTGVFLVDYMYFFLFLTLYLVAHFLFYMFVTPPQEPKTKFENLKYSFKKYFTYSTYLRLFLGSHFYMFIAVFVEFKTASSDMGAIEIISLIFA